MTTLDELQAACDVDPAVRRAVEAAIARGLDDHERFVAEVLSTPEGRIGFHRAAYERGVAEGQRDAAALTGGLAQSTAELAARLHNLHARGETYRDCPASRACKDAARLVTHAEQLAGVQADADDFVDRLLAGRRQAAEGWDREWGVEPGPGAEARYDEGTEADARRFAALQPDRRVVSRLVGPWEPSAPEGGSE